MKKLVIALLVLVMYSTAHAQPPAKAKQAYAAAQNFTTAGKYKEALDQVKLATQLYPRYYEAYTLGGSIFATLKMQGDAIFCYRKALQVKPDYCPANIQFGDFYKNSRGKLDSAFIYLSAAAKAGCADTSRDLNFNLGYYYNDKGNYDLGIVHLKKAIALDPLYKSAITELSYSYRKKENYDEAIREFREMHSKNKMDIHLYYIGMYYIQMKKKEEALAIITEMEDKNSTMAKGLQRKIDAMK